MAGRLRTTVGWRIPCLPAAFMMLLVMANAGLLAPALRRISVIMTAFKANFWVAFLAGKTLIFVADYTLWMYKIVIFGAVVNDNVSSLCDVNKTETIILSTLASAVLVVGIWPAPLLELMQPTIQNLIEHIANSKLR